MKDAKHYYDDIASIIETFGFDIDKDYDDMNDNNNLIFVTTSPAINRDYRLQISFEVYIGEAGTDVQWNLDQVFGITPGHIVSSAVSLADKIYREIFKYLREIERG